MAGLRVAVPGGVRRWCKRIPRLGRIRGGGRRARFAAGAAALVATVAVATPPVSAAELGNATDVCTVTMTLSFSTPITALPSTTPFTLSTTGGSCLGGGTATVTTSLGSVALDADCEMVVTVTSGSLSVPGGQAPVTVIGAGPSLLQSWTFIDTATVGALEATGVFAWVDAPQIEGCLLVGTSSMTLSGELVAVP